MAETRLRKLDAWCPTCAAAPGEPCLLVGRGFHLGMYWREQHPHTKRPHPERGRPLTDGELAWARQIRSKGSLGAASDA